MILRQIAVHAPHGYEKQFNTNTYCIVEMYWFHWYKSIKKHNEKAMKVNISLVISKKEFEHDTNLGGFYKRYILFNPQKYFSLSPYEKKKMLLDITHNTMMKISDKIGVDKKGLIAAYKYCLEKKLQNKWLFKDKYYKSPDKKYYAGIECNWTLNKFELTGILLDNNKKEILRKKITTKPAYKGEFIYYTKCYWKNNKFIIESQNDFYSDLIGEKKWILDTSKIKTSI